MFEKIIKKINAAECVGIFAHVNPDGDALGSAYSLRAVLRAQGKRAEVFPCSGWQPCVFELVGGSETADFGAEECDLMIALDCADLKRLGEWSDTFAKHSNTAAIDHHITHIPYAGETVVQNISSTCELMFGMYKEMGISLSAEAASDLYIGIVTDTGCFKYSSVTGDTMRAAAELMDLGIDFAEIDRILFNSISKEYLRLQTRAAAGLEFFCNGRVALLRLSQSDFDECGTDEASASAIVTLPVSIEGVEVGIYIRERGDGESKVSLRSVNTLDVAELASMFGGGGHVRAAGYSVKTDAVEENIRILLAEIEKQLSVGQEKL